MKKIDIKLVAIGLLLLVVLLQQMCGGRKVVEKPIVVIKTDTIYVTKTVTQFKEGKTIYQDKPYYVPVPYDIPIDTAEILKDYFAKIVYKDTLHLPDNLGTVSIRDTITQNRILNRQFNANVREKIVNTTTTITNPPKTQVYVGAGLGVSKVEILNSVSVGVLLKTKRDVIYGLNLGLTNTNNSEVYPYVGGNLYWKIKLKK